MTSNPNKKLKLTQNMAKQICTHSGNFQADESLAVYMLRLLPQWKDAKVVRSRNPDDWAASDIVVDVGAQYDGTKFFDHHQRGFMETFSDKFETKLSSAGLVYKHFGKDIIKCILETATTTTPTKISEDDLDLIHIRIYEAFMEAIDANDNGIDCYDLKGTKIKPKFKEGNITIPGIVSQLNPKWNEDHSSEAFDRQFFKASEFVGGAFVDIVKDYALSWLPAKSLVKQAIETRKQVDPSGKIILLSQYCPWKEHLYDIEKELGIENEIQFVLFEDSSKTWRVSTVPVSPGSFSFRRGLPENLRGLRDEELSEKSGVPGCVFIHASGFIGGATTQDSVLQLARMSL